MHVPSAHPYTHTLVPSVCGPAFALASASNPTPSWDPSLTPPPPPHYLQEQADVFIQVTAHKVVMSSAWQEPALLENLPQRPVALKVRLTASLWPARTLGDTCPAELAPRRSASGRVTATY